MRSHVIIIDPLSSGTELAPAFKARGIPVIAVTFNLLKQNGFGSDIHASDFTQIIPEHPELAETLRKYKPIAIIPGTEEAVPLAEHLTNILTPQYSNDPEKSSHRLHKSLMQTALEEKGLPVLKSLDTSSEHEAEQWIKENDMVHTPLIIKPPVSAGSDKVFHIEAEGDWKKAFNRVLTEPTKITGKISSTAVIQEQATGEEFAVGTVSANGKHYLSHIIKYHKIPFGDRKTIYDHVEFVPYNKTTYGEIFKYTKKALDALGIRWGAAHTEIMLTPNGPRLIESGARMCGGPVVEFSRTATGSSQADKLVELFIDGDILSTEYLLKKTVVPVFLNSPVQGTISNAEALNDINKLPTLLSQFIWFKNGDTVPKTVDYLTSIGIIALAGDRDAIYLDYQKIRNMESKLIINPA